MTESALNQIKEFVLEELKKIYPQTMVSLWFEPLKVVSLEGTTLIVSITEFKKNFVENQYFDVLKLKFSEVIGVEIDLQLISDEEEAELMTEVEDMEVESAYKAKFDPDYTFENFIVGKSNQLAQSAALAVARNPADLYNPLFLYGPSGLGKTHLLFAIMNEIRRNDDKLRETDPTHKKHNILYVSGEEFTNEMIESLTQKKPMVFREKFRNVDVLLVDDIQFIAGKLSVQEEFFHTFDTLFRMKKQIILASDRAPKDINNLEERLKTRFEMGLVADIQPPDLELRVSIFKRKTMDLGFAVNNEVLFYLATNITTNIRQIEGALKKLRAHALITGADIDYVTARDVLSEYFANAKSDDSIIDRIFEYAEKRYGVKRDEMKSAKRNAEIIAARHYAIYLIRKTTNLSQNSIAKIFNKKDHTTVINSISFIERKMNNEPAFEREMLSLIAELRS